MKLWHFLDFSEAIPCWLAHFVTKVCSWPQGVKSVIITWCKSAAKAISECSTKDFFRSHGLVNEKEFLVAKGIYGDCEKAMEVEKDTRKAFQICEQMASYLVEKAGNPFIYDIRQYGDVFSNVYSPALSAFFNQTAVKNAFHVPSFLPWNNGDGTAAPNPVVNF